MRTTVEFYVGVLGMRLVRAARLPPGMSRPPGNIGNPPFEEIRYYFFEAGHDICVSFFEVPEGATGQADRNSVGGMQQLAFATSEPAFRELKVRLQRWGSPILAETEILPGLFTLNFLDPNGIRLEALCRPTDDKGPDVFAIIRQASDTIRAELATLDQDPSWLARQGFA